MRVRLLLRERVGCNSSIVQMIFSPSQAFGGRNGMGPGSMFALLIASGIIHVRLLLHSSRVPAEPFSINFINFKLDKSQ